MPPETTTSASAPEASAPEASAPETVAAESAVASPVVAEKPRLRRRVWNFTRHIFKDKTFRVATTGAKKGAVLAAQGAIGLVWLLTLPIIIQPVAVVACCALVGVGLSGLRYGVSQVWKKLEKFSEDHLHFSGMRRAREAAESVAQRVASSGPVQEVRAYMKRLGDKIANSERFQKTLQKPVMQKIMSSRPARFLRRRGLTPKQQDLLLAGLTIQGSLVTLAVVGYGATHGAGLAVPFLPVAGVVAAALGAYVVGSNAYSLFCGARSIKRTVKKPDVAAAPAPEEPTPQVNLEKEVVRMAFNDNSAPEKATAEKTPAAAPEKEKKAKPPRPA